jgi:hypothetical protein
LREYRRLVARQGDGASRTRGAKSKPARRRSA